MRQLVIWDCTFGWWLPIVITSLGQAPWFSSSIALVSRFHCAEPWAGFLVLDVYSEISPCFTIFGPWVLGWWLTLGWKPKGECISCAFMLSVILEYPFHVVVVVQCNFSEELCVSNARCDSDQIGHHRPFLPKEKNQVRLERLHT